ncbi:MAG TPA: hypothetical protein VGU45_04790 [Microvirga sp.]|jgi:localization factor PodJL|nr:hypothetical protein [Microvirga sp.]
MIRNASSGLDLETREAVEAAARRSGLSLDEWVKAAVVEHSRRAPAPQASTLDAALAKIAQVTRPRGPRALDGLMGASAPGALDPAARTALAFDSVAGWIEQAEARLDETVHATTAQQERLAGALAEALHTISSRLDQVETREAGLGPDLASTLAALRQDVAALAARLEAPAPSDPWHAALQGIEREVERLRACFGGLVTRDEVATLEDLVRGLAADIAEPGSRADMAALAESVAHVQAEVRHLAQETSQDLHRRITQEVEGLARKLDQVAAAGAGRAGVEALGHQLADMRQALARMADPQRIERLAEEVAMLGRHVAEMRVQQVTAGDFAGLKSALEDIRVQLQRSEEDKGASEVPAELKSLNRRLDLLMSRPEPAGLDPITAQLSTLTERIGSLASSLSAGRSGTPDTLVSGMESLKGRVEALADSVASAPAPVLGRLDQLETTLRAASAAPEAVIGRIDRLEDVVRQIGEQTDMAPLEIMVRELLDKLERGGGTSASLDGLEQRLETLTTQITRQASDQVQQALAETLVHVKTLRGEAAIIAERAAKAAIREAHAAGPVDAESLRQGFAELRALQADAEKRTQATLKAVHNALETLMARPQAPAVQRPAPAVPPAFADAPAAHTPAAETPPAVRLEAAVRKLHAAALSQAEPPLPHPAPAAAEPEPVEVLLEPGAPRGVPGTSFAASQEGEPGHARANFIAAARRAAQAASADATGRPEEADGLPEADGPISNQTLIDRIRQTFDSHRKPLLLSMALLILVAGSMQTITRLGGGPAPSEPRVEAAAKAAPAPAPLVQIAAPARMPGAPAATVAAAAPAAPQPPAEVSIDLFEPVEVSSITPAPKRIPGIAPSDLPSEAPGSLVEAAERGDGAAVYELASRLAEGRTLPREPAMAAKLFEKAAQAGVVPAQFRIANLYEKGVGVTRDLALARTWYERAAAGGNTRAMHNLAVLFAEGAGSQPDYAKAGRWFQEAAEFGVRDSQYNLAVLLARGLGVKQDLVQSYKWFQLAAAQGDDDAGRKRDEIGGRLSPEMLAAAKALAAGWRARPASPEANEAPQPALGLSAVRSPIKRS